MIRGLVSAIRTLSILPVPGKDTDNLAQTLPWFPLVGFLLGTILYWLTFYTEKLSNGWAGLSAIVVLIGSVVLTRGLHLDGLADWADGFAGGKDRKRILAIMKDSMLGAFGVTALILVLLLKWNALTRLIDLNHFHWIIPIFIISRFSQVFLAVWMPYARSEGGTASPFVENARYHHLLIALVLSVGLIFMLVGGQGLLVLGIGCGLSLLMGISFKIRVGGITGDLLGVTNEIVETGLFVLCVFI